MPRTPSKRRAKTPAAAPATAEADQPVPGSRLGAAGWRCLFLGACLALGLVQAYVTVARFDPAKQSSGDESQYLAMSRGLPLAQALAGYRWRVLTPLVVGALPNLPTGLLKQYQVDPFKLERVRFAAWNTLGNVAAAWCLMLFMEALGFSLLQSGLGALLFCTSFQVLTDGASILVDPWANAALVATLLAGYRRRWWVQALVFGAGLFVKETVVVALPLLWLLQPRGAWTRWLAVLPGLAAYLWFREVLFTDGPEPLRNVGSMVVAMAQFTRPQLWLYMAEEFTLNFLWLAPLAWLGWPSSVAFPGLRRMAWVLPLLVVLPMLVKSEFGRPWFNGFPVFIPLAVLGLWRLAGLDGAAAKPVPVTR